MFTVDITTSFTLPVRHIKSLRKIPTHASFRARCVPSLKVDRWKEIGIRIHPGDPGLDPEEVFGVIKTMPFPDNCGGSDIHLHLSHFLQKDRESIRHTGDAFPIMMFP